MAFERVRVLGAPVDLITTRDLLDTIAGAVQLRRPVQIVTVNAEYIMRARRDPLFLRTLNAADIATPDGAGVLWALRRRGIRLPERVGGSDLIWSIPALCARAGSSIFLLGGAPGVASTAAQRLVRAYPGLEIAGAYGGGPGTEEEPYIVDLIRRSAADILFVAFGAPQQDVWIARNLARTGVVVAMGVGGSLDYVAGTARRAPVWMQERGVEWLWRLLRQPRRWRRMLVLPQFAWLVWTTESVSIGKE